MTSRGECATLDDMTRALMNIENRHDRLMVTGLLARSIRAMLAGVSRRTATAYESRLRMYLRWYVEQPEVMRDQRPDVLLMLNRYVAHLTERGLSVRSVRAHWSTVKQLYETAAALDPSLHAETQQLRLVRVPRVRGEIIGTRLDKEQAQALLDQPGTDTARGVRDSAILGLMLACGLRRSEVVGLTWGHLGMLDGVPIIRNLRSKHGRVRSLKIPHWLWNTLLSWGARVDSAVRGRAERAAACLAAGQVAPLPLERDPLGEGAPIFLPISRGGRILVERRGMTAHSVRKMVMKYARMADSVPDKTRPHDLRRTAAAQAYRGGADIGKVQAMLGHASPATTSAYIGEAFDIHDNAVDYIEIEL